MRTLREESAKYGMSGPYGQWHPKALSHFPGLIWQLAQHVGGFEITSISHAQSICFMRIRITRTQWSDDVANE